MLPEVGHFLLCLCFVLSAFSALCSQSLRARKATSLLLLICFVGAFLALVISFAVDDFSVAYVATHSHSGLAWYYKITALWGGHEGSMMLWLLWLLMVSTVFAWHVPAESNLQSIQERASRIICAVQSCLLGFILWTSNPFLRLLFPTPTEGGDLNPLLQDIGFILHPPILYAGYVACVVPFAWALAVLLDKQAPLGSITRVIGWAKWALAMLTLGITLGSWWAYYELGWGGWWFWDPVENAALLPWLSLLAFVHTVLFVRRTQSGHFWAYALSFSAFGLSLLGTFLVRSGLLSSVHTFAVDPERGVYLLSLFTLFLFAGMILLIRRQHHMSRFALTHWRTVPAMLYLNNLSLVLISGIVLIGTLYPLVAQSLFGTNLTIGPDYFVTLIAPIALPSLTLLAVAIHLPQRLPTPVILFTLLVLVVFLKVLPFTLWAILGATAATLVLVATTLRGVQEVKAKRFTRRRAGMHVAHLGFAVAILGMSLSSMLDRANLVKLGLGERSVVGPYEFLFEDLAFQEDAHDRTLTATVPVLRHGTLYTVLFPQKRHFIARDQVLTETAIQAGWVDDLYVALGERYPDGRYGMRIAVKPFVRWIWAGGALVAFGILLSWNRDARRRS